MSTIGPELEFASRNPDYWGLLVPAPGQNPEQLDELDERRRQAFDAARLKVQEEVGEIVRAVHTALQNAAARTLGAGGPDLTKAFSRTPNRTSLSKGGSYWKLMSGKGKHSWVNTYISQDNGRMRLFLDVQTSKKRTDVLVEAFSQALEEGDFESAEMYAWVSTDLDEGRDIAELAKKLVESIWPGVVAYVTAIENRVTGQQDDEDEDDE